MTGGRALCDRRKYRGDTVLPTLALACFAPAVSTIEHAVRIDVRSTVAATERAIESGCVLFGFAARLAADAPESARCLADCVHESNDTPSD